MINGPTQLSTPVQTLVDRALSLCQLMLAHGQTMYPFAAIYEDGKVGCLFADDTSSEKNESYLIEQLQWRIIDTTTDTNSYSILVYAATVNTDHHKQIDAIAINATDPAGNEILLIYPYLTVGHRVVISPPLQHG